MWTWTVLCADTKLVPVWRVGDRSAWTAADLFRDLQSRVNHRIQIIADGHAAYIEAVPRVFGPDVDFAMLVKLYGDPEHVVHVSGRPEPGTINTCFIERHNWTMRTMRRFTRKGNGFSRKLENHAAMVSLYVYVYAYNFIQPHRTLKNATPAMAAGVTDEPETLDRVVHLIDQPRETIWS